MGKGNVGIIAIVFVLMIANSSCACDCNSSHNRAVLRDVYEATKGAVWSSLWRWSISRSVCEWQGVGCNGTEVTSIVLVNAGLLGTLPASLGNLSNLTNITIADNALLSGELPTSLQNCKQLVSLTVVGTSITGTLPTWIAQLGSLEVLQLGYNNFFGSVLPNWASLTQLRVLMIEGSNLFGGVDALPTSLEVLRLGGKYVSFSELPLAEMVNLIELNLSNTPINGIECSTTNGIPDWLGTDLSKLVSLDLAYCCLVGTLPQSLGSLTHLQTLVLYGNQLDGTLPQFLRSLSNLVELDLSSNGNLSGSIPAWLGSLSSLRILRLDNNNFTGEVIPFQGPTSLEEYSASGNENLYGPIDSSLVAIFPVLRTLSLSSIFLSGTIPGNLGQLVNIRSLDLSSCSLSGPVPNTSALAQLERLLLSNNNLNGSLDALMYNRPRLVVVDVSNNNLDGSLPASIDVRAPNLEHLKMDHNSFSGTIPSSIGNLRQLSDLTLGYNAFSGTIPASMGGLTAVGSLSLQHNMLNGSIPPKLFTTAFTSVELQGNQLTGSVPETICGLRDLTLLDLSANALKGTLPSCFGDVGSGNVIAAPTIDLHNNRLEGSLPSSFSGAVWSSLDLSLNRLNGTIPYNLSMRQMTSLNLNVNRLSGTLPLGTLLNTSLFPVLIRLHLNNNTFSGPLDTLAVGGAAPLLSLTINNNNLGGSLPSAFPKYLPSLVVLFAVNCSLVGAFPNWTLWKSLKTLNISRNNVSGSMSGNVLPRNLGSLIAPYNSFSGSLELTLPSLVSLVLHHNRLSGTLPLPIAAGQRRLVDIDLSYNTLSGPLSLGNFVNSSLFPQLVSLRLDGNALKGPLLDDAPAQDGGRSNLEVLTVSISPNIGGTLPVSFPSRIPALKTLMIRRSGIRGTLPSAWAALSRLKVADLSGNQLKGRLPSSWARTDALTSLTQLALENSSFCNDSRATWMNRSVLRDALGQQVSFRVCSLSLSLSGTVGCSRSADRTRWTLASPSDKHSVFTNSFSVHYETSSPLRSASRVAASPTATLSTATHSTVLALIEGTAANPADVQAAATASVAMVAAVGGAALAGASAAASFDSAALAAVGLLSCSAGSSSAVANQQSVLRFVMSPFFDLGAAAVVLGNAGIVVATCLGALFLLILLPFTSSHRWKDAASVAVELQLPSRIHIVASVMMPGIALSSSHLLSSSPPSAAAITVSLLGLLLCGVLLGVEIHVVRVMVRPTVCWGSVSQADIRSVLPPLLRNRLIDSISPKGKWYPRSTTLLFGSFFAHTVPPKVWYLHNGLCVVTLVTCLAAGVQVPSNLCVVQFGVIIAVHSVNSVVVAALRPFRAPLNNVLTVVSSLCLIGIVAAKEHTRSTGDTAVEEQMIPTLTIVQSVVGLCKTVYVLFVAYLESRLQRTDDAIALSHIGDQRTSLNVLLLLSCIRTFAEHEQLFHSLRASAGLPHDTIDPATLL